MGAAFALGLGEDAQMAAPPDALPRAPGLLLKKNKMKNSLPSSQGQPLSPSEGRGCETLASLEPQISTEKREGPGQLPALPRTEFQLCRKPL